VEEEARELLYLAGLLLADSKCWTRDERAARRWTIHRFRNRDSSGKRLRSWSTRACAPKDTRAFQWSVMGALELVASEPDGPMVLLALELLRHAGRGHPISRVEAEGGHEGTMWVIATAVLGLEGTVEAKSEVDLTFGQEGAKSEVDLTLEDNGPPTERSFERNAA
jgi:hypothetical protein